MQEILKKIDANILQDILCDHNLCQTQREELSKVINFIDTYQDSQKSPCYSQSDCEMKDNGNCTLDGPCPHLKKQLTIGDKIRESNESLAEFIENHSTCDSCTCHFYENKLIYCNREMVCRDGILGYLNQPVIGSKGGDVN